MARFDSAKAVDSFSGLAKGFQQIGTPIMTLCLGPACVYDHMPEPRYMISFLKKSLLRWLAVQKPSVTIK